LPLTRLKGVWQATTVAYKAAIESEGVMNALFILVYVIVTALFFAWGPMSHLSDAEKLTNLYYLVSLYFCVNAGVLTGIIADLRGRLRKLEQTATSAGVILPGQ
jgi:hypothetical protein